MLEEGPLSANWIECSYYIEATTGLEAAAAELVGEQTSGTFIKVPGESDALAERFGGRVLTVKRFEDQRPSLRSRFHIPAVEAGIISVAYPVGNFGADLTTLLTVIAGNLYELGHLTACRLVDIDIPEEFCKNHAGPAFGIQGTRSSVDVVEGPLIGTIIKPNIGLLEDDFRSTVRNLLDSGVDFLKDDEINANPAHLPFDRRVEIVCDETERAADKHGRKVPYAFNVAGPLHDLERKHNLVLERGGQCVMLPVFYQGVSAVEYLRALGGLQIHAHRAGFAAISRSSAVGIDFTVWQKVLHLAGADHIHASGLQSKFYETDDEVASNIKSIQAGVSDHLTPSLPVLSSGQTVFAAQPTLDKVGSTDVMMLAGGGIIGHPLGASAGVSSLRQAWEAASRGIELATYGEQRDAKGDHSLSSAIDKFGDK